MRKRDVSMLPYKQKTFNPISKEVQWPLNSPKVYLSYPSFSSSHNYSGYQHTIVLLGFAFRKIWLWLCCLWLNWLWLVLFTIKIYNSSEFKDWLVRLPSVSSKLCQPLRSGILVLKALKFFKWFSSSILSFWVSIF